MSAILAFPRSASAEQRVRRAEAQERLARILHALKLADKLDARGVTSTMLAEFELEQWAEAAADAIVAVPSQSVRSITWQMLLARETARELARKAAKP